MVLGMKYWLMEFERGRGFDLCYSVDSIESQYVVSIHLYVHIFIVHSQFYQLLSIQLRYLFSIIF